MRGIVARRRDNRPGELASCMSLSEMHQVGIIVVDLDAGRAIANDAHEEFSALRSCR
jgi:hypothetical protein